MPRDYVEGMWRILQQDEPDDYVLATGETHTVREFVELAFHQIARPIAWRGEWRRREAGLLPAHRRVMGDRRLLPATDRSGPAARRPRQGARQARLAAPHELRGLVAEMVEADRLVMKNMGAKNGHEAKLHAAQ
jgi:GDPmannose 4,6-dehydratase